MRRIAQVFAFAVLLLAAGNAFALTYAEAYQACAAFNATQPTQCVGACGDPRPQYSYTCRDRLPAEGGGSWVLSIRTVSPSGTTSSPGSWQYSGGKVCPTGQVVDPKGGCRQDCTKPQDSTGGFTPPNGSIQCRNGCDVAYYYNGDGTSTGKRTGDQCDIPPSTPDCSRLGPGYYWHPNLNACVPIEPEDCDTGVAPKEGVCKPKEECPQGMHTDENGMCKANESECPAGQIKSPEGSCLPGDGQCAVGEVRRPNGTCGKDSDGDGQADDDDDNPDNDSEKNEFSGGDSCTTPPSCSGDAIMCGQARIQWRIDCNTRRNNNITGGGCDSPPICTGEKCNAMEYAQLLQQWRTSCAVQKLAAQSGTGQGGDTGTHSRLDRIGNFLDGNGQQVADVAVPWQDPPGEQQWSSGLGSGTCPAPISTTVTLGSMSKAIEFSFEGLCEFADYLYWVVVTMGGLLSAIIIAGVRK